MLRSDIYLETRLAVLTVAGSRKLNNITSRSGLSISDTFTPQSILSSSPEISPHIKGRSRHEIGGRHRQVVE